MTLPPLTHAEKNQMLLRLAYAYCEDGLRNELDATQLKSELMTMALRLLDEQRHPDPPIIPVDPGDCPY